jgi:hypothetical protein
MLLKQFVNKPDVVTNSSRADQVMFLSYTFSFRWQSFSSIYADQNAGEELLPLVVIFQLWKAIQKLPDIPEAQKLLSVRYQKFCQAEVRKFQHGSVSSVLFHSSFPISEFSLFQLLVLKNIIIQISFCAAHIILLNGEAQLQGF